MRRTEEGGPNPPVTPDMEQALALLGKLAALDIAQAVCYHGGLVQGDVQDQLAGLARRS